MSGDLGRIAAVVCNFDGREHLPHCLAALRGQTRAPDPVLVVDNASSDGSRELVARDFPWAQLLALPSNEGPCPARNAGLAAVDTEWVLLVDNDAVLAPDALARLEAAALAHPDGALFQPRSVHASDPSRVHYDGAELHYAGLFSLRNYGVELERAAGSGVVEVGGAVSVALLAKRRELLDAGGFDPSFFILFEDLDLSMRLRMRGARVYSVEDALCAHRGGTSGISYRGPVEYPRRRVFLHTRNRWLHLLKNHAWRTLFFTSPALALYELAWLAFAIRAGALGTYCRGRWALLRSLGAVLRARRGVQRARILRDRELLVGGPLTIAPQLDRGGASRALAALDLGLRAWWRLVRPLCG
jgi:hypothetical protein